jgi:hypothetical protein
MTAGRLSSSPTSDPSRKLGSGSLSVGLKLEVALSSESRAPIDPGTVIKKVAAAADMLLTCSAHKLIQGLGAFGQSLTVTANR